MDCIILNKKLKKMKEKQIILSKFEFDEMEQELKALKETVESKTVTSIFRRNWYDQSINFPGQYMLPVGTRIEFVMGSDVDKILEEFGAEIETLRGDNKAYQERISEQSIELYNLKNDNNSWKRLPWHKRLFVK
jgi:hypothetical protein